MAIILKENKPSEKLLSLVEECSSHFGKLCDSFELAKTQGLTEGFTSKEVGDMIRRRMLKAGYSRMTVSRYLPEEFKAKPRGFQFSNKMLLNSANKLAEPKLPDGCQLIQGDCTDSCISAQIADNSVDLIFTDPPYDRESVPLFGELAKLAMRVLKDEASLVTFYGEAYLPEVLKLMQDAGLMFNIICTMKHGEPSNNNKTLWDNHAIALCKHLLWMYKPPELKNLGMHVPNFVVSNPPDKSLHEWAQSPVEATHFIEKLTLPNQIVLDPFMGSGTTGISALDLAIDLKRQFIGIEIDPVTFAKAQMNISCKVSSLEKEP